MLLRNSLLFFLKYLTISFNLHYKIAKIYYMLIVYTWFNVRIHKHIPTYISLFYMEHSKKKEENLLHYHLYHHH